MAEDTQDKDLSDYDFRHRAELVYETGANVYREADYFPRTKGVAAATSVALTIPGVEIGYRLSSAWEFLNSSESEDAEDLLESDD